MGESEETMENMIHIGNKVSKEAGNNLLKIIQSIFEHGFKNRISDAVMVKALDVTQEAFAVKNVTITNSVFESGKEKTGKS